MPFENATLDRHLAMLDQVNRSYLGDEAALIGKLSSQARPGARQVESIEKRARGLVAAVRNDAAGQSALDRFLAEYSLDSAEGVLLMCLAEAFQRVPDAPTADALISDKLALADWAAHLGNEDLLVHAATFCFMLGGRLMPAALDPATNLKQRLVKLVSRVGEPLVRAAVAHAMSIMSDQFVMGSDIEQASARALAHGRRYERYSFDILGEAALTHEDAERYFAAYEHAITTLAALPVVDDERAGLSVKLSALFPRYEPAQAGRAIAALTKTLGQLARQARSAAVPLTVDAEESARLTLSLAVFDALARDPDLRGWDGLGLAVQAYQKRAPDVIEWLTALARDSARSIPVRLVKGAYWDSEIKQAQALGLDDYPVFTRKCNTDVAYLACARQLLRSAPALYPQFATHNAHTIASIIELGAAGAFEFQRLHGMGDALYRALNEGRQAPRPCRVYAPVGDHAALLPYLVRRLLENGANTSFVHRIADHAIAIADITADPIAAANATSGPRRHRAIAVPPALFGAERRNSRGHNFADPVATARLLGAVRDALKTPFEAAPVIDGEPIDAARHTAFNPADTAVPVGSVASASAHCAGQAVAAAAAGWPAWETTAAEARANILERVSDNFESRQADLLAVIVAETGRTVRDAHAELREAVDLLRFYAAECRRLFGAAQSLPGPVGEANHVRWRGRGVMCCISPWNFPLAIFSGQVAAALAAGNSAIAKPAEQASLTAAMAARMFYDAGVPTSALQLVPGEGPALGAALLGDPRVAAVAFTGSDATARSIAQTLAVRAGPIAQLVAETGGINALIADSTALAEQVVQDAVDSAFNSAGQRCSGLRILCLQRDIAPACLELLRGRMRELVVGNPLDLATDVGPLIDERAAKRIRAYIEKARDEGRLIEQRALPTGLARGHFVAPALVRIDAIAEVSEEIFGPVLHVYEFDAEQIEPTCDAVNNLGYGLTFGIHSRLTRRADALAARSLAGNVYVNRNIIGAVVESQPFGGRGLSGTGPKAGGHNYVARFATEQAVSVNTAAAGGNPSLLGLED